jgi:hypothetical protein
MAAEPPVSGKTGWIESRTMTDDEKLRIGSRNRQLRLVAEYWPMVIPIIAIVISLLLPLIQAVRAFFRGF